MKNTAKIKPSALYWASFNRFELRLPGQCVLDCSHQGQCDEDVAYWVPRIQKQCERDGFRNRPAAETIREELEEYGAWDAEELANDEQNWHRLIWCAACNIAEEDGPDYSEPVNAEAGK